MTPVRRILGGAAKIAAVAYVLSYLTSAASAGEIRCSDPLGVSNLAYSQIVHWLSRDTDGYSINYEYVSQGIGHASLTQGFYHELVALQGRPRPAQEYTLTENAAQSLRSYLDRRATGSVPGIVRSLPQVALGVAGAYAALPVALGIVAGLGLERIESTERSVQESARQIAQNTRAGGRLIQIHYIAASLGGEVILYEDLIYAVSIENEELFYVLASCAYPVVVETGDGSAPLLPPR